MSRDYHVYILAGRSRTLYVGVTSDLVKRLAALRDGQHKSFTRRYRVNRLVYVESTTSIIEAIAREKQLKGWTRERKLHLVEACNPLWLDLSDDWRLPCSG